MQIIRLNSEEYIDDIMEVEHSSFTVPWSRNMFKDEFTKDIAIYFGAVSDDNKAIAYGGMWKIFDEGHITNIAVHKDFRRRGIAQKILDNLFEYAKENGIVSMTLEVRVSNSSAISLYEKNGFESCGVRKGYYEDNNEDAVIMWKNL